MQKNLTKQEQTGRSMVEMLGVLAVIGVLSITGISGYTTAMNKHKANEILDAASKRAVAVSTQIQRGKTDPTLDEFETNTVQGATFGTPVKVGDNQFKLPVTWASDSAKTTIGAQIKNIAGDGTGTVLIDDAYSRFLYNNDLSNGVSNTNNRDTNDATKCSTGYKGTDCDSCDTDNGYELNTTSGQCEVAEPVPCTCTYGPCVMYKSACVSKYYSGSSGTWNDLNAMTKESDRCPDGGKWATMDQLVAELGCHKVSDTTCDSWPSGLFGWTATSLDNDPSGKAWYMYLEDGYTSPLSRSGSPSENNTYNTGVALCVR